MWSEVTAIFGGTFDPPHLGHREAIQGLLKNPGVRAVRVVPSGAPALKSAQTSAADRLEMARLAFADIAEIDDREIRRQLSQGESSGPRPSYTYDTLREIRAELGTKPDGSPRIAFVLGADQIDQLDRWYRFPELLALSHWIALARLPEGSDRLAAGIARLAKLGVLETTGAPDQWRIRGAPPATILLAAQTPALAISSTAIRQAYARGEESRMESVLAPSVREYIAKHLIYG